MIIHIIPSSHHSNIFCKASIFLLIIGIFIGCTSGGSLDRPPEIRYGEDACDECHMLINEARYASAFVTGQAQTRRFDDIGCMLIYINKHQEDVVYFWVKDFNNQNWLPAEDAVFVKADSIQTPMGFGIVAVADEDAAKNIAGKGMHSKMMDFSGLQEIKIY